MAIPIDGGGVIVPPQPPLDQGQGWNIMREQYNAANIGAGGTGPGGGGDGGGDVPVPSADFVPLPPEPQRPSGDWLAPQVVNVPPTRPSSVNVLDALGAFGQWLQGIQSRADYTYSAPWEPQERERKEQSWEAWQARQAALLRQYGAVRPGQPAATPAATPTVTPGPAQTPPPSYAPGAFSPSPARNLRAGTFGDRRYSGVQGDVTVPTNAITSAVLQNPTMLEYARHNNLSTQQVGVLSERVMRYIAEESARSGAPVTNRQLLDPDWMGQQIRAAVGGGTTPTKAPTAKAPTPRAGGGGGARGGGGGGGGGAAGAPAAPGYVPPTVTTPTEPNMRPAQPNDQGILFLDDSVFANVPSGAVQDLQRLLSSLGFQATGVYGRYLPTEWRGRPGAIRLTEDQLRAITSDPSGLAWLRWLVYRLGWFGTASPFPTGTPPSAAVPATENPAQGGIVVTA